MSKSHVGMGFSVCPICYEKHDEVVLLDRRLQKTLTQHEFMGFDLCPKHKEMQAEYVALVEVKNGHDKLTPKDAKPTGMVAMVKRDVAPNIFNVPIPDDMPFIYVEEGVISMLQAMTQKEDSDEGDSDAVPPAREG